MSRKPRRDPPDSWHHVGNRGQAHRSVFTSANEAGLFFEAMSRGIQHTGIEIHACTVLATHFHLLVRSPGDALAKCMQIAKSWFVRKFNKSNERDGSLFSSRFWNRLLVDLTDRILVTRYIDANPVRAGLVARSIDHPWGSAHHYSHLAGPPWLNRTWVESIVAGQQPYRPQEYDSWSSHGRDLACWLTERRFLFGAGPIDPADYLPGPGEDPRAHVRAWLDRNHRIADGAALRWPITTPDLILAEVASAQATRGEWRILLSRCWRDAWTLLRVGLLRNACGLSLRETATLLQLSTSAAERASRSHEQTLLMDREYSELHERLLAASVHTLQDRRVGV